MCQLRQTFRFISIIVESHEANKEFLFKFEPNSKHMNRTKFKPIEYTVVTAKLYSFATIFAGVVILLPFIVWFSKEIVPFMSRCLGYCLWIFDPNSFEPSFCDVVIRVDQILSKRYTALVLFLVILYCCLPIWLCFASRRFKSPFNPKSNWKGHKIYLFPFFLFKQHGFMVRYHFVDSKSERILLGIIIFYDNVNIYDLYPEFRHWSLQNSG